MTDKMSTKEEYSTYYSSRGVDPAMYDDVKLPSYLMQVIDPEETILELGLYNKCCGDTNCIFAAFIFLPEKR